MTIWVTLSRCPVTAATVTTINAAPMIGYAIQLRQPPEDSEAAAATVGPEATVVVDFVNKSKLDLVNGKVALTMFTNNLNKAKQVSSPERKSRPPLKVKDESEIKKPKDKI